MTIGIDIRCLLKGRKAGVEEYTLNLLENIFTLNKENSYVLFLNSWRKSDADIDWIKKHPNVKLKSFHYPNKFLNFSFWYFNWPKIDKMLGGVDLFFMPNIIFGSVSSKAKLILTIHDLSFEYLPETFSLKKRLWHIFVNPRKLCQRAEKIITVSSSTKNDVVNFYRISAEKVEVIYSATADSYEVIDRNDPKFLKIRKKYGLPYYFILYLGAMEPRKNIIGIIKAYNQLRRLKNPELDKYKLVIAGAEGWKSGKIISEIENSPFKNEIMNIGFIETDEKPYLYNLASLFVYPSLFEGFGLPPLEAMGSGVPVIASNNSSLPEIAGNAGILIDPEKPDEIFRTMREVLLNKNLRLELSKKGIEQAKKFSWEKAAQSFLEVIKSLENK
ncbi:MAG: glycosyltransferase family 1 protein [bacterium]|nr:glycosyltransferase family 1 protein [bacterium]